MSLPHDETAMSASICEYVSKEIISNPGILPITSKTHLIQSKILDSLSMLRLVRYVEQKYDFRVGPDELTPENFETIDLLCEYISRKKGYSGSGIRSAQHDE